MFGINTSEGFSDILPGIRIKTLVHGEKTLMSKFLMSKGSVLPQHNHPYEQTGYLLKGKLKLIVDKISYEVKAGDSWCIKADVVHSADVLEDSVALEIFTPVRQDYQKYFSQEDIVQ